MIIITRCWYDDRHPLMSEIEQARPRQRGTPSPAAKKRLGAVTVGKKAFGPQPLFDVNLSKSPAASTTISGFPSGARKSWSGF
jgi:hypothetical protein